MRIKFLFPILISSILVSPVHAAENACANVEGVWIGEGVIDGATLTCAYAGKATAVPTDNSTAYNVLIELKKKSAYEMNQYSCPGSVNYTVRATCDKNTGVVVVDDDYVNLSGMLSQNGTALTLDGSVEVLFRSADAHIELTKSS